MKESKGKANPAKVNELLKRNCQGSAIFSDRLNMERSRYGFKGDQFIIC